MDKHAWWTIEHWTIILFLFFWSVSCKSKHRNRRHCQYPDCFLQHVLILCVCLKSSDNNFLSLQTDHDMRKRKRNIRGTKKLGCPAVVHVYEMLKFPDFNVCLLHSDIFVECGLYANPCLVTCTLSIAIEMRSKMLWLTAMTGGIKITQEQCQGLSRDRLHVEILRCFTLSALKTTNYFV